MFTDNMNESDVRIVSRIYIKAYDIKAQTEAGRKALDEHGFLGTTESYREISEHLANHIIGYLNAHEPNLKIWSPLLAPQPTYF